MAKIVVKKTTKMKSMDKKSGKPAIGAMVRKTNKTKIAVKKV